MNHFLGKSYTLVTLEKSPEHFKEDFKHKFERDHDHVIKGSDEEKVFAFISGEDPSHIQPLYSSQQNYVMGADGKTLSTIRP